MVFASLAIFEILLAAVFLWITPLDAALAIVLMAALICLVTSSFGVEGNTDSSFFSSVFNSAFLDWLRRLNFSDCLTLFRAEGFFLGAAFPANGLFLL